MADAAFQAVFPSLQAVCGRTLWVADENALSAVQSVSARPDLYVLSNRYDVVAAALIAGHQAQFSDFNFSIFPEKFFSRIVFRIAKEKPVNHYVFNHAFRLLDNGGEFHIAGLKNEGIKTFIAKLGDVFGGKQSSKFGLGYLGKFCKAGNTQQGADFDDQQYQDLRMVETATLNFYSKPGLFGWDKIDQGSQFLGQYLPDVLLRYPRQPESLLDLGCGYGYLTLMTRDLLLSRRVATDNNAAALLAMQCNATHYGMQVDVVADDAGASISEHFDIILSNPPFHQGFSADSDLTDKFLKNTRRLLAREGAALMVVNAFIGIERIANQYFTRVETLANNGAFKLLLLQTAARK
jgi:16S rRNA (guanine1207-N2)-methyltransferase